FCDVPTTDPHYRRKTSGLTRDTMDDARLRRPGSQLRFGKMAGRRSHLRKDLCRHARERTTVRLSGGNRPVSTNHENQLAAEVAGLADFVRRDGVAELVLRHLGRTDRADPDQL